MSSSPEHRDAVSGSLLGLAIGDALGTTIEFAARDTVPPVTDIVGGGPFNLEPGQWTDDTSLALCIASSLAETGAYDPRDQLERFVRWRDHGFMSSTGRCFDMGYQTSQGLDEFLATGTVYRRNFDDNSAGNGSLMRLAPVPLAFASDIELAGQLSADSSYTTHPATDCVESCRAFGQLIAAAVQQYTKDEILGLAADLAPTVRSAKVADVLAGSYRTKSRDEISSSGYVIASLEAALWAFDQTDDFASGALLVVNLADDSDTVGAIYGQLAGAHYGRRGIPKNWREIVYAAELIEDLALAIYSRRGNFEIAGLAS